jgi:hypothetical protein
MLRNKFKWLSIPIVAVLIAAFLVTFVPDGKVSVSSEGDLSIGTHIALAAQLGGTNGLGEPLPQEPATPIFGRGGLPIVSVTCAETGDLLMVVMSGMPTLVVRQTDVQSWASIDVVELTINTLIQRQLEIWTPLTNFPKDDPVRNGILCDNERIETSGRDYLVTTLGYGAIHIYSLSPFKFITRFNGLDAGPVTGVWW